MSTTAATITNLPRMSDTRKPGPRIALACKALCAAAALVGLPVSASAQAGHLDNTFGASGRVLTHVPGPTTAIANAVALQSDGKIVVAGGLGDGQAIGLVRYNSNGTLDGTFGKSGIALADIPNNILSNASGVAIQLDGKIVAGGTAYTLSGVQVFIGLAVIRFDANGSLDSSFGTAGVVTALPFNSARCGAGPVALQPDGKILLAGGCVSSSRPNSTSFSTILRLNTDGSVDSTFGVAGAAILGEAPSGMRLQCDGKILVIGGGNLTRYNANGSVDLTFGIFGSVGAIGSSAAVTVQTDGKILVAGTLSDQLTVIPDGDFAVVRYNIDGTADQTFGKRGGALADFFTGISSAAAVTIALQSNGDIVVAGKTTQAGSLSQFAIARFTSSGTLDTTFGRGGVVTTSFGQTDAITAIAIQLDGKILALGNSLDTASSSDSFALARYLAK